MLLRLALLLALSACGGGGDGGEAPPSDTGTLAYVVTACRDTAQGFFEHQALHILHGDQDVTVMETPEVGPVTVVGLCKALTLPRDGETSIAREAFQGLAVSPDGAAAPVPGSDRGARAERQCAQSAPAWPRCGRAQQQRREGSASRALR